MRDIDARPAGGSSASCIAYSLPVFQNVQGIENGAFNSPLHFSLIVSCELGQAGLKNWFMNNLKFKIFSLAAFSWCRRQGYRSSSKFQSSEILSIFEG